MGFNIFFLEGILKINSIKINNHEILVKKGWGLLKEKKYRLKDIEGFYNYTRKVRRKKGFVYTIDEYKYLLLVQNGKIVARISQQYHKNYREIANFTQKHLLHLGHKKPGLLSEIKDAVKF
ncbi:hypothetical protein GN157_00545 [Flavobacterium rakeshii]|uniref:Uncharacterized protein n=1 Tax=Flavobacterium rakeshii TaxID=1038845 RepID=A0A6N8H9C2_9FLAO|nr:hypothetical protein [Flavobacterium rakeshii]MEE1898124.1 hypothetical protein [Flavobacterium rakeshii]MUV02185.1 hypothetical protein [Flavobacterium rakeshii]